MDSVIRNDYQISNNAVAQAIASNHNYSNEPLQMDNVIEDEIEINTSSKLILFTKYFQILSKKGYNVDAMCRHCNVVLFEYLSKCSQLIGHLRVCAIYSLWWTLHVYTYIQNLNIFFFSINPFSWNYMNFWSNFDWILIKLWSNFHWISIEFLFLLWSKFRFRSKLNFSPNW